MKIPKIIENICQTENVEIVEPIRIQPELSQYIIIGIYESQKVIVKIFSVSDKEKANRTKKEKIVSDLLSKKVKINFCKVIRAGENDGYFWIIREYIQGDSLTLYNSSNDPLMGYDHIKKKYLSLSNKIPEEVVSSIFELQKVDISISNKESWNKRFTMDAVKTLSDLEANYDIDLAKQKEFYQGNISMYGKSKSQKLSTGDLVPSNIIISTAGEVFLSDFEWACIDNYSLDIAQFWLYLWKYSSWQKCLVDSFLKSEEDKIHFHQSVIRLLAIFLNSSKSEEISFYKKHVWIEYLYAAGESFDAIMSVKAEEK